MLERLAKNKHSILLQTFVNYRRKEFITLGTDRSKIFIFGYLPFWEMEGGRDNWSYELSRK